MLQPGQVSEGPFLNDPQTVDVPHRTAETRGELWVEISCNYPSAVNSHTRARRSHTSPPGCGALKAQRRDWQRHPEKCRTKKAAAPANNCWCCAVGTCRVLEVRASLTSEPGCGATGRRASGSPRWSRSGRSRCGTNARQQVSTSGANTESFSTAR